jgi:hypothetical protein
MEGEEGPRGRQSAAVSAYGLYQKYFFEMINLYTSLLFIYKFIYSKGARGSVVVEALSYKPEGRGIASR